MGKIIYFRDAEEDLDCRAPDCGPDLDDFRDDEARVYHANGMIVYEFDDLVFKCALVESKYILSN